MGRKSPQGHRGVSFIPGPPAALWLRLLDHLSSLTLLVKGGLLRMRSLLIRLRSKWDFRDELLRIPWGPLCKEDLLWWSWAFQQREGVDLSLPVPDLGFYSDESDVGWGAIVGERQVSGVFGLQAKGNSPSTSESSALSSEARRSLSFATMSRQSLISGDWEARGLRSCSSKRGRFSSG